MALGVKFVTPQICAEIMRWELCEREEIKLLLFHCIVTILSLVKDLASSPWADSTS